MSPTERLNELLANAEPSLDRVLAVIASVDPETTPSEDEIVEQLDQMAERCPPQAGGDDLIDHVLAYVFGDLGFTGDTADYYNPANSLIHRVLERRRGLPLTLAAVAAEITRRRGADLRLIGMPGHILLGQGSNPTLWFDPFSGGARLGYEDCRSLFARFHPIEAFQPSMLAPINAEAITIRMLNNLRIAYTRTGQAAETIPVLELRAAMSSAELSDRLELANLLAGLGRFERAADEFEGLAEVDPERAEAYLARAQSFRAHLN